MTGTALKSGDGNRKSGPASRRAFFRGRLARLRHWIAWHLRDHLPDSELAMSRRGYKDGPFGAGRAAK
jgi:hypothetical protein